MIDIRYIVYFNFQQQEKKAKTVFVLLCLKVRVLLDVNISLFNTFYTIGSRSCKCKGIFPKVSKSTDF